MMRQNGFMPWMHWTVAAMRARKGWTIAAATAVLMLVLAIPIRRAWCQWRLASARHLSADASRLVAEGHGDKGVSMLWRAYQMAPSDPETLRALARSCDLNSPDVIMAVTLWNRLVQLGSATVDDGIELARARLAAADFAGAEEVLSALPPEVRRRPRCAEVMAGLLRGQGLDREAEGILRAAWELHPEDPACRVKLACADYASPFVVTRAAAGARLWTIVRGGEPEAADAALALLSDTGSSPAEVAEICRLVRDNCRIKPAHRREVLAICAGKLPGQAGEIIEAECRRFAGKAPVNCVELYEWLAKIGVSDRILEDLGKPAASEVQDGDARSALVPRSEVLRSRGLFLAYGDALMQAGRWDDFRAVLQLPELPISRTEKELMRMLGARGSGEPECEISRHLESALAYARRAGNPEALLRVALAAEQVGRLETAIDARSRIRTSSVRFRLENLEHLYRLHTRLADVDGMIADSSAILGISPGLKPYVDDLPYLKLLAGTDLESTLDELGSFRPGSGARLSAPPIVRALAAYRIGERESCRAWVAAVDPALLPLRQRAVLAGLLRETGRVADGMKIAEKVGGVALLPDERWFLEAALR